MYYLIESEYVGPNKRDSHGNLIGDSRVMSICTKPGKTNSSHEARTDGWLGTTNDNSLTAHGEFETLEAARAQWDADQWLDGLGRRGTCTEYGITAKTTDEELREIVDRAEREANAENVELHGTDKLFTELRDELKSEAEEEA